MKHIKLFEQFITEAKGKRMPKVWQKPEKLQVEILKNLNDEIIKTVKSNNTYSSSIYPKFIDNLNDYTIWSVSYFDYDKTKLLVTYTTIGTWQNVYMYVNVAKDDITNITSNISFVKGDDISSQGPNQEIWFNSDKQKI